MLLFRVNSKNSVEFSRDLRAELIIKNVFEFIICARAALCRWIHSNYWTFETSSLNKNIKYIANTRTLSDNIVLVYVRYLLLHVRAHLPIDINLRHQDLRGTKCRSKSILGGVKFNPKIQNPSFNYSYNYSLFTSPTYTLSLYTHTSRSLERR